MFSLKNKVILLFGAAGYLGTQFSKALLEAGAKVYGIDIISEKEYQDVNDPDERFRNRFYYKEIDASNIDNLLILRELLEKSESSIDVVINATTTKGDDFYLPFEEVSLSGWEIGLKGNLTIPFLTTQTFIPVMKRQRRGSIINISSVYGIVGNDQRIYEGSNLHEIYVNKSPDIERIYSHGVYNASKGGIISFSRYLAAYYGEFNIRVNTISPGGVHYENENDTFVKKYSDKVPLRRKARPDEINGAVVFLSSDASSYITGHNLVIDGGYSIW